MIREAHEKLWAMFDREHDLESLLPMETAERLCRDVQNFLSMPLAFLRPDGGVYAGEQHLPDGLKALQGRTFPLGGLRGPQDLEIAGGTVILHPVLHENEVIGLLCLGARSEGAETGPALPGVARFLAEIARDMIRNRQACLMTSELHSEVVEGSYAALQERNECLEASERKYRNLARSLEEQVREKTREIQETQLRLMEQEKLASIGQLAAGVAHEINNPIGFIQSNLTTLGEYTAELTDLLDRIDSEIARLRPVDPDEPLDPCRLLRRSVAEIKETLDYAILREDIPKVIRDSLEGTERVAGIVGDLKAFAHLDKAEQEHADLNRGIRSAINMLRSELRDRIEVVEDLGELPPVLCYPQRLNQVFMNLLRNAIQAVSDGGRIHVTSRSEGDWVRIHIRDSGTGIPEAHLNRIFDPFFTTREVGEGMGLGLTVTHNTVRAHGGTVEVESRVGEGTGVTLRIPVAFEGSREKTKTEGGRPWPD